MSSNSDIGGIRTSTIFPWTLEIIMEDDVFAKAFCIMDIQIKPGAKNSEYTRSPEIKKFLSIDNVKIK